MDIVVEGTFGDVAITVGVECTAGKRPASVEWVNEMAGKHARLKAQQLGMEPLQLEVAENQDWDGWLANLDQLRFAGFTLTAEEFSVTVSPNGEPAEDPLHPEAIVEEPPPAPPLHLDDCVRGILRNDHVFLPAMRGWLSLAATERPSTFRFQVTWNCAAETTITSIAGKKLPLKSIVVNVRVDIKDAPLFAKVLRFRDRSVLQADVPDALTSSGNAETIVAMFGSGDSFRQGAALVTAAGSNMTIVYPMRILPQKESND